MAKTLYVEVEFNLRTWLLSDCKVIENSLRAAAERPEDGTFTGRGDVRAISWGVQTPEQAQVLATTLKKVVTKLRGVRVLTYEEGQAPRDLLRSVGAGVQKYLEDNDDQDREASYPAEKALYQAMQAAGLFNGAIVQVDGQIYTLHTRYKHAIAVEADIHDCG